MNKTLKVNRILVFEKKDYYRLSAENVRNLVWEGKAQQLYMQNF